MGFLSTTPARVLLLLPALLSLFVGALAGVVRSGTLFASPLAPLTAMHGAMMVAVFFGAVISLERAVALQQSLFYCAPALSGAAAIVLLMGDATLAALLCCLSSLVFCMAALAVIQRLRTLFTFTLAAGSASLALGNFMWLLHGHPTPAIPAWLCFLLLTIAGERLELTRLRPVSDMARRLFVSLFAACLAALPVALYSGDLRWLAAVFMGFALWMMRFDLAWHHVKGQGLPRFIALALLSGYVMLALGAGLGLSGAFSPGHALRDAALHAIFLGFAFAMVMGHAPVIFPAILRVAIPYHPLFYLPLCILHGSMLARILGRIFTLPTMHALGVWGNVCALALLFALLPTRILSSLSKQPQ